MLSAIIFDVDGTLVETEELHRQAFNITFAQSGLSWHWSQATYSKLLAISGGQDRIRYYAATLSELPDVIKGFSPQIEQLHSKKTACYKQLLKENRPPLRPGILRLITEARQSKLRLAIASCASRSNIEALLGMNFPTGWQNWFEVIATHESVSTKKPSPEIYEYVLKRLNLPPDACLAIEDTPNGNLAANDAGIHTLITTHPLTEKNNYERASLVVNSLGEPDLHFSVLAGDHMGHNYVDISLLRKLVNPSHEGQHFNYIKAA